MKNRAEESIEIAVVDWAIQKPAHGQSSVANEFKRQGILISAGGVRST